MQTIGHSTSFADGAKTPPLLEQVGLLDRLKLALICGALLGFSNAAYGVWWLAWLGLSPLLLLIFGSRSRMEAMLTGLTFGFAYHLLGLRFLLDLYPMTWLQGLGTGFAGLLIVFQLWVMESLHQAVLVGIFALFVRTLPLRAGYLPSLHRPFFPMLLSVPIIWIFLQWIIAPSPLFLGVPIDQLAYSQAREPALIQIARYGGAQAVDFLIVLVNAAVAALVLETTNLAGGFGRRIGFMSEKTGAVFDLILALAVCGLVFTLGRAQVLTDAAMPAYFQQPAPAAGFGAKVQAKLRNAALAEFSPAIPVAVLQGALRSSAASLPDAQNALQYLPYINNVGASIIVLPACFANGPLQSSGALTAKLAALAASQKKDVMVGWRQRFDSGIQDGVHIFSADRTNIDSDYTKFRLLPAIESTPLTFLDSMLPAAVKQHFSGGDDHIKAGTLTLMKSVFGRVGACINEEIVYPDLIVSQVNRGASLLVDVSDLSSFHKSILGQELLAAAVLRAVENGRYVLISSNGGESAVVDPFGVVTSAAVTGDAGLLLDRVQFLHNKTPYSRMCVWTPLYH
jgi:apolipoprotein N-acyltransferase